MSVFIVGGDHLGDIRKNFERLGFNEVIHLRGRKNVGKRNLRIPREAGLVVVLTDYVNHNITSAIKEKAKNNGVPVIYAKRSWPCILQKLCFNKSLPAVAQKIN